MLRLVIVLSLVLGLFGCNKVTYDISMADKDQDNVEYTVEVDNNTSPVKN